MPIEFGPYPYDMAESDPVGNAAFAAIAGGNARTLCGVWAGTRAGSRPCDTRAVAKSSRTVPAPGIQGLGFMIRLAALCLVWLQLAGCSHYDGPITNAPPSSGSNGLPGLTGEFAP